MGTEKITTDPATGHSWSGTGGGYSFSSNRNGTHERSNEQKCSSCGDTRIYTKTVDCTPNAKGTACKYCGGKL